MKTAQVTIEGLSALLMHKFPIVAIEGIEKLSKEDQAEHSAYRSRDGELHIPGVNLQRALVAGGVYSKGKGRASLQKTVAATALVTPEVLTLGTKEYDIDSRRVVIKATGGAIVRHRPRIDDWGISFNLTFDPLLITEEQLEKVVMDTGMLVGLMDFRPEKKGPFGRFAITSWEKAA